MRSEEPDTTPPKKSPISSVGIFEPPRRNEKNLPKFDFILPNFRFILPKFYFVPLWGAFVCSLEIPSSLALALREV